MIVLLFIVHVRHECFINLHTSHIFVFMQFWYCWLFKPAFVLQDFNKRIQCHMYRMNMLKCSDRQFATCDLNISELLYFWRFVNIYTAVLQPYPSDPDCVKLTTDDTLVCANQVFLNILNYKVCKIVYNLQRNLQIVNCRSTSDIVLQYCSLCFTWQ